MTSGNVYGQENLIYLNLDGFFSPEIHGLLHHRTLFCQFFVKSLSLYPPQTGGFKRKMLILPTKNSDI